VNIHEIAFDQHLQEAEAFHGHLCGGIVTGVRMALRGLREIGIQDPKGEDRKSLMVFVEIDRCATDAITSVTGCRPGKRTMKIKDFGKMAATFINLDTGKAVRLASKGRKEGEQAGSLEDLIKTASDEELFLIQEGHVPLGAGDLPGKPVKRAVCARCGESILDMRDLQEQGQTLCQPCAEGKSYFIPGEPA